MADKLITNSEASAAAKALIDHFFHNSGASVKVCIPATDEDTDLVLTRYLRQQESRDAAISELVNQLDVICENWGVRIFRTEVEELRKAMTAYKAASHV